MTDHPGTTPVQPASGGPQEAPSPAMSERVRIERAIADITRMLKGPMSNIERALLVEDRRDFRRRLEGLDALDDGAHDASARGRQPSPRNEPND